MPKESFFDSIPVDLETADLNDGWGINKLPSYKLNYFLRRVRNAVSHGRIEFNENLEFTFTDRGPKNDPEFSITLSSQELLKFIQALSYWCINKGYRIKWAIKCKSIKRHPIFYTFSFGFSS